MSLYDDEDLKEESGAKITKSSVVRKYSPKGLGRTWIPQNYLFLEHI